MHYYFFWPTSTKPVGTKTLSIRNNGLQRASWYKYKYKYKIKTYNAPYVTRVIRRRGDGGERVIIIIINIIIIMYKATVRLKHYIFMHLQIVYSTVYDF